MAEHQKKPRYEGYSIDDATVRKTKQKKGWFWKILLLSLLISVLIIAVACTVMLRRKKAATKHTADINKANTMEKLLKGHENVKITEKFSNLAEDEKYTKVTQVEPEEDGFYSYVKVKGSGNNYKEVIKNKEYYHYDGNFTEYIALLDSDYEEICLAQIEGTVFQIDEKDSLGESVSAGNLTKISVSYTVQDGDIYTTKYQFKAGDVIDKEITMETDSMIITTETEACQGDIFYSYSVAFDAQPKLPSFYQKTQEEANVRTCAIYADYNSTEQKEYTYQVPADVYFTTSAKEGYKIYADPACQKEFSEYQEKTQNPLSDIQLYMVKE